MMMMKMMTRKILSFHFKHCPLVAGTPRKISGPRARDLMGLLEMQLVLVSGGRDKRGGPTITFPASTIAKEKARPEDYSKLLHYLTLVPRFVF